MKKYYLSFQTVFRLNENIRWLEEFLIYYINMGVDHFYLYNNDGSTNDFDIKKNVNKYGYKIENEDKIEDKILFDKILEKYGDRITYTRWKPLNSKNEIVYGQDYATMDFIKKYSDETEWIALMDLDEFLFSVNNINIVDYLKNLSKNTSCVRLYQKNFVNRFESNEKYITQDYRCMKNPKEGGTKNIVRTSDFVLKDKIQNIDLSHFDLDKILKSELLIEIDKSWTLHIHFIQVNNEIVQPDMNNFRFNHYNINDISMLNDNDDLMNRYKHLFYPIENFISENSNLWKIIPESNKMNQKYNYNNILIVILFIFILFILILNKKLFYYYISIFLLLIILGLMIFTN